MPMKTNRSECWIFGEGKCQASVRGPAASPISMQEWGGGRVTDKGPKAGGVITFTATKTWRFGLEGTCLQLTGGGGWFC